MKWIMALALAATLTAFAAGARAAEPADSFNGQCDNGATVKYKKYCAFFSHFRKTSDQPLDPRIKDTVGVDSPDQTRSIALIIAISKYPKLTPPELTGARIDGDNLERFLVDNQKFDEVIVLRDGDATPENINYFLGSYLPLRADDFAKKARLLIAYTGHGRPDQPGELAAFILGGADDVHGANDTYTMTLFGDYVSALAGKYFHVLTLINACYGGSIFKNGQPGGNANAPGFPGSYAITAGSDAEEVPALEPKRGSLFFDLLIDGVNRGVADTAYWEFLIDRDGKPIKRNGLVRTSSLSNYLTSAYERINQLRKTDGSFTPLKTTWIGPAQKGVALGGFFFLTPGQTGAPTDLADAYGKKTAYAMANSLNPQSVEPQLFSIPPGPVSSVKGDPSIKVFKQPEVYPIHGFDISSADGSIDWKTFVTRTQPRFVYARAVGWKGPDKTFRERWSALKEWKVDRGAYIKFSFCDTTAHQLEMLKSTMAGDPGELPLAVELVTPSKDQDIAQNVHEVDCYTKIGVEKAKAEILDFAAQVNDMSGRIPLFFGNSYNLSVLKDDRSNKYMVWLGSYSKTGTRLVGSNPWTLWQYSGSLDIPGIGKDTTGDVFFGTEDQYAAFKLGRTNVARDAVSEAPK